MAQQAQLRRSRGSPLPVAPGEAVKQNKVFRDFKGINTQAQRNSIDPDQFSWLENAMPIGPGNMRVVRAISDVVATLAATSYYQRSYDIANTAYMFFACTDGSAYQVLLSSPFTIVEIAPAGTFSSSGTQIAQWKNERILIVNQNDYYGWDGTSLTTLGGTTSAPTAGQCIATYAGRVWISQGRTIYYSAAGSYTNFAGNGGNTIITDETLVSDITQLLSANNFLYFFGIDSINVIADVQVVGAGTSFSNTNISANSGSNLPQAIIPYFRAIWYMNQSGIYALYGATPRKASDDLDGIFENIDFTQPVTAGTVMLYNILCAAFMFVYNDPANGLARPLIAIFFNQKWFVASQSDDLILMATNNSSGNDDIFATDGTNVYQLFEDADADISHTLRTALWDFGNFIAIKESMKLGIECVVFDVASLTPTVDTEVSAESPSASFNSTSVFDWVNGVGAAFSWVNGATVPFTWLSIGYVWFQGDVSNFGHYLGITVQSSDPQTQYIGLQLQHRLMPGGWGE